MQELLVIDLCDLERDLLIQEPLSLILISSSFSYKKTSSSKVSGSHITNGIFVQRDMSTKSSFDVLSFFITASFSAFSLVCLP